jgi:hypothetical protein
MNDNNDSNKGAGFGSFAAKKMLPLVVAVMAVLGVLWIAIQFIEQPGTDQSTSSHGVVSHDTESHAASPADTLHAEEDSHAAKGDHDITAAHETQAGLAEETDHKALESEAHDDEKTHASGAVHGQPSETAEGHGAEPTKTYPVVGMAFVDASIQPMDYELNHRFFGWRPNDIIEWTDNVNNFQLGVLEVTRRTSRILAERISRTGSSASFDPNLERAMNWFMIKADRYWFPSAESKYREGLEELREYFYKLERGEAHFYTRTDNLIPLLSAYQDLLGSCDENLVKTHEADGSPVSFFKADDYFYYTKGVASALYTILKAIEHDFQIMVSREGGLEVLHHAIEMCHQATEIEPWIVLNSGYSSIFANHRSNMAAPISHARFYIGVLIKALST